MTRLLTDLAWPVTTERLSIRPAEQRDAAATFAFRALPEVAEWVTSQTTDLAAWEAGFGGRLADTLVIELDGDVVGDLMLRVQDGWAQSEVKEQAVGTEAEIGYTLAPTHGGRGLATEAVRALLEVAFDQVGVRRVIALCFADNEPSWRLMERLGMRREQHTKQDSLHRNGQWLDGMMYAILADEWRSTR
ncbi:GCN5-related N-acetyltransferase [metagenome]|uniref:GCN5-related N-acetyltransferase n=1 Tax=metagenome TaxID=256318 RepID=A0A2P2CAS3_9ZZZZ